MTQPFDDKAIAIYEAAPLLWNELAAPECAKPKNIVVRPATVAFARPYIAKYHYSHLMPDSTMDVFAGWLGESLAGIICYGVGAQPKQFSAVLPDIQDGEYRELTRLWSPDSMPRNTESRLIAESLRLLPIDVRLVLSYADPQQGHIGTIYQATNWLYLGQTSGGTQLVDADGRVRHSKSIAIYRLRHPELKEKSSIEIMALYGWRAQVASPKHKYVMLRGSRFERRKMLRQISPLIKSYPKETKDARPGR